MIPSLQLRLSWQFALKALLLTLPLNQQPFASATSEMGILNKLPCGLDEVDVIIAGGELPSF